MKMTEREAEQLYKEALNEQGVIKIGNLAYEPAYVLKAVDPTAYRCGFLDYIDSLAEDGLEVEGYSQEEEEESKCQ